MTIPTLAKPAPPPAQTIENVLVSGDLSGLTLDQRREYFLNVCKSLNLNPLTQPFYYLRLGGKLVLYPNRTCADQLRKNNGISIEVVSQELSDGVLTFHVRAKDSSGRQDEDIGSVAVPDTMRGENRANQVMKAITKAKRRVTLSISGLGWPDETEIEDIPGKEKEVVDLETGEVIDSPTAPPNTTVPPPPVDEGPPREITLGDNPDWIWFGQKMISLSRNTPLWEQWLNANKANLERMEKEAYRVYQRLQANISKTPGTPDPYRRGPGRPRKQVLTPRTPPPQPASQPTAQPVEQPQQPEPEEEQPLLAEDPEGYLQWLEEQCSIHNQNGMLEYQKFAGSQGSVIAAGFPADQPAANDIIKRYMPR